MAKLIIILTILFFQNSCVRNVIKVPAEINVSKSEIRSGLNNHPRQITINIPSTNPYIVPGTNIEPFIMQSTENSIAELSTIELRKKIYDLGRYRIGVGKKEKADFTIRLSCTEFVRDVNEFGKESKAPTLQAASIIAMVGPHIASAAPFMGPVGALISSFQPLTGIALGKKYEEIKSMLTLDIQILDQNGEILLSKPYSSSFMAKAVTTGKGGLSSSTSVFASSSTQDAIRTALDSALKVIQTTIQ